MLFKIDFHSMVDVITNSSSIIYTYSDGCIEPAKELINEFAKSMGYNKTADEMFTFGVFCEDDEAYYDHIPEEFVDYNSETSYEDSEKYIDKLIEQIMAGEVEKPEWMENVEDNDEGPNTNLYIWAKEDKYKELGKKLTAFLYSADHEVGYDG
jgi:hypothetical protein